MESLERATFEGFRLSSQQRHAWWLQRASALHACQIAVRMEGALDVEALEGALADLVESQEILRTVFRPVPGLKVPVQVVTGEAAPKLARIDLPADGGDAREACERLLRAERRQPFDLEGGAPFRASLVRQPQGDPLLVLSLSPLCADARTMQNLLARLASAYAARRGGGEAAPEAMQYADFSEWQNDWLGSEEAVEGKDHWRQVDLSSHLGPLLPGEAAADGPLPAFDCETLAWTLPRASVEAAEAVAGELDIPVGQVLLAVWQALLGRLSGRSEIAVAVTSTGRSYAELEHALGPFSRALPVVTRIDRRARFRDLLEQAAAAVREAEAWQDYYVSEEFAGTGSFLPCSFTWTEGSAPCEAAGLTLSVVHLFHWDDRFSLRLCARMEDELRVELQYDPGAVSRELAGTVADRWQRLFAALVADPGRLVGDVEILTADERGALDAWNRTDADLAAAPSVHALFEAQARACPQSRALVCGGASLTYGELDRQAGSLAAVLRERGVGPETTVALLFERSIEMVVALLGVLEAGGAYVALDPEHPPARLADLLEQTSPVLLLTQSPLLPRVPPCDLAVCCLDGDDCAATAAPLAPPAFVAPGQLAYTVFTSGSSGRPKGVLVPHSGVVNYLSFLRAAYELGPSDVVLQIPDLGFDSSVRDLIGPLTGGARVVLVDRAASRDPQALLQAIRQHRVTCLLSVVPTLLRTLVETAEQEDVRIDSLRLILASGEVLREADAAAVRRVFGDAVCLFNQYGPTECTMTSSYHPALPAPDGREGFAVLPIGRPIANVRFHLLDDLLRPVPPGSPGEVYIAGAGLTRGYLGAPDLTADRFFPDPFAAEAGRRMYRTGDLAVHRADGVLEFGGRIDQQVKVRGVRVEPEEIAAALLEHPAVRQAVVVAREDAPGGEGLVAYLVPERRSAVEIPEEQRYVLPNQMLIAHQNRYETDFFYHQIFVDQVELRHGVTLDDGAVVFDVGSNIGLFSLFVHRACRNPRVLAFEPMPETFATLRANMELYGLRTQLFNCGISERDGEITFAFYPHSSCQSGYYPDAAQETRMLQAIIARQRSADLSPLALEESRYVDELVAERMESHLLSCPVRTISSVLRDEGIDRIDLLKIDVEKSELDVLRGVADEDWPKIRQIVIEGHDLDGRLARITELLEDRGYELVVEQDHMLEETCLYNVYAFRDRRTAGAQPRRPLLRHLPLASSALLSGEELRSFLRDRLPEALVPAAFVLLDALPVTPNGKVDRRALPAPERRTGETKKDQDARHTPTEQVLEGIWANLLNVEGIDRRDNFFELGGHSLSGTRMISRIREVFNIDLRLRKLFELPTLEGLAAEVDREVASASGIQLPPLRPMPRGEALPPSLAQQRLWFLQQLDPQSAAYNIPGVVRLAGALDLAALERAASEVVRRHETLRTVFPSVDGEPVQVIRAAAPVPLPMVDLTIFPESGRERRAREIFSEQIRRPFDLAAGPLVRFLLLRLAPREHALLVNMHHIVSDGWSVGVLVRELSRLYEAFSQGLPSPLPALPVQYADFALWQRQWLRDEALETQIAYWRRQLADAPAQILLPASGAPVAASARRGARQGFALSLDLTRSLKELSRREECTVFILLLAGIQTFLCSVSGQDDIVIGSPASGRQWSALEGLIGFHVNILPLRTSFAGDPTFLEILSRVRRTALEAYAHQHVPFDRLVQELRPERSLDQNPIFQVTFNFLEQDARQEIEVPGLVLAPFEIDLDSAQFDWSFNLFDTRSGLAGSLRYRTDLFDPALIGWALEQLQRLLGEVARDPAVRLSELKACLADAEEQRRDLRAREIEEASLHKLKTSKRKIVNAAAQAG